MYLLKVAEKQTYCVNYNLSTIINNIIIINNTGGRAPRRLEIQFAFRLGAPSCPLTDRTGRRVAGPRPRSKFGAEVLLGMVYGSGLGISWSGAEADRAGQSQARCPLSD